MLSKQGFFGEIRRNVILYLMLLPAVVYFFIFSYIPMAGIILAFKNYVYSKGIFLSPWAGFDNFRFFFISGKAFLVTRNTVLYNLAFIITSTTLELLVAIFLSELSGKLFKKVSQSILFLPYFISWVMVGALVYNIFNFEYGSVNTLLKSWGMHPLDIYNTPSVWKYIFVVVNAWKWVGYGSILYLSAIMGIDQEFYEAAKIDGANIFRQIWHITLPLLVPTIVILTLLNLGTLLRGDFSMFYQLVGDQGTLYNATDIIDTFVFRALIRSSDIGMASAAGFYQSVFCFITIMIANYSVKKVKPDYSLF